MMSVYWSSNARKAGRVTSLMTGTFEVPGKRGKPEYNSAKMHPRDHKSISVPKGSPNST